MRLTANVARIDGWWTVEVPAVPGLYTQARRLDQVAGMVADAASLLTGKPASNFEVNVVVSLSLDDPNREALDRLRADQERLRELADTVQDQARSVAAALHDRGLSYRELGTVLGVSHQRAHQLAASAREV